MADEYWQRREREFDRFHSVQRPYWDVPTGGGPDDELPF